MRRMKYQGNDKASGSRTHDKDESQVLCYNCRKPGHFKSECPYPIVKKHQDEHNYKKNSGRYHYPKSNPNDADEDQEDSDEEMCLMAEEEEVTSQNQSSNYSSESICHENPREAFEKMMKSFYGIEDSHLKLKEENAKLLGRRREDMPPSPHVVSHHRRVVLLLRERKIAVAAWNHDPAPMSPPAAVAGTTPTPYVARYRSTPFMEFAITLLCCAKENKGGEKLRHGRPLPYTADPYCYHSSDSS
nr:suppressor protein SRP40-like [Ipomoea batatas]